jgi:hypothetical protein
VELTSTIYQEMQRSDSTNHCSNSTTVFKPRLFTMVKGQK